MVGFGYAANSDRRGGFETRLRPPCVTSRNPPRKRRSLASLTSALERASTRRAKARAHYALALFHDNNGREAQAIPHYRSALALGVRPAVEAEAHAWLASSLHKTGHPAEARQQAVEALSLSDDPALSRFLMRLLGRIGCGVDEPPG